LARKILLETGYTFTPATKTLAISKYIARERIISIVNTTTHHTLYDFAQPELNFTSYTATTASSTTSDTTTLVFRFNTASAGMSSTDKLQITVDEYSEKFTPAETQLDPTNKFRTSSPQALIDTDFEYGTQVSKWENLATTNLRPYAYSNSLVVTGITDIQMTAGSRVVTVSGSGFPFSGTSYGQPLIVQDTLNPIANGTFAIDTGSTPSATSFTYLARAAATVSGSIFDTNKTQITQASFYTGAAIGGTPTITTSSTYVTVTTTIPHGLSIGNEIQIAGTTAATSGAPNGTWVVANISSPTTFQFISKVTAVGAISGGSVYARPQGAVLHRPFDGGVIFSSNGGSNYESQVRQTRRYFRYQSGKGIQMSSGTILKPNFQIDTLTYVPTVTLTGASSSGTTVTVASTSNVFPGQIVTAVSGTGTISAYAVVMSVTNGTQFVLNVTPDVALSSATILLTGNFVSVKTKDQHNVQPGSTIVVSGANETLFNGSFAVYAVTGYNTFTYTPTTTSTLLVNGSGTYSASITNWYGAVNRLGIFDQQNGLFFEFDGQQIYAVRRNSTYQISGRVNVNAGSSTVTSNSLFPTIFSNQLAPGDFIVIRGASYRVDSITSNTSLTISPAYRGASNITGAIVSKTIDTRIPQSQWNIDKMDGTGPSGYNLDLSRMQMFYIDYSWYGAGFIRWGLRGATGDVTYVHKMQNNNVNTEAYMRSGNLPGRYESSTLPPRTTLGASINASVTTIPVASTVGFPSSGTAVIKGPSAYEYFNYTGLTSTSFTGVTRMQNGVYSGSAVTMTVGSNISYWSDPTGIQVGQRVVGQTDGQFPESTYVTSLGGSIASGPNAGLYPVTFSQALAGSTNNPYITTLGMGTGGITGATGQSFTYSATAPIAVELAFPTFAPTISHWGTSVIMDGRFDDDKSLLFTYGQTATTGLGATAAVSIGTTNVTSSTTTVTAPSGTTNVVVGQTLAVTAGTGVLQGSTSQTIANQTPTGTTNISITTGATHNIVVGQQVLISGVTPTAYNGTWIAQSGTTGTTLVIPIGGNPGPTTGAAGAVIGQTVVTAVTGNTTFTVNPAPSTALSAATVTVAGASTKALFSIRIAPSVDNGRAAAFGARDLVNRMQLVLRALDIALQGSTIGNLLVTAVLNGTPQTSATWSSLTAPTSSLAQIADYSGANATVNGGEITGGFFVSSTNSVDLSLVRDLGNSVLGGGGTTAASGVYPDGPDVLTIVVQNLSTQSAASVVGRLSWTEAQA
jgi:hypothetical protein